MHAQPAIKIARRLPGAHAREIRSCRERPPGAREDHHSRLVVVLQLPAHLLEIVVHLHVDGVELLRAIQRYHHQPGQLAISLYRHSLVRQGMPPHRIAVTPDSTPQLSALAALRSNRRTHSESRRPRRPRRGTKEGAVDSPSSPPACRGSSCRRSRRVQQYFGSFLRDPSCLSWFPPHSDQRPTAP